jgi:hypothetical protein
MANLNLSARKSQLPASAYPERADIYVCDKCEKDITRHFIAQQSHSWRPLGRERYLCQCGQSYLTGAVEWTNLSEYEKNRRIQGALVPGIIGSVIFSIFGLGAYLLLRVLQFRRIALFTGLVITVFPFVAIVTTSLVGIALSSWRTKVRRKL